MTIAITGVILRATANILRGPTSRAFSSVVAIGESDQLSLQSISHPQQAQHHGLPFPLILQSQSKANAKPHFSEWCRFMRSNSKHLRSILERYGAILFRGLPVQDALQFDQFVKTFGWQAFPYTGGNAPRSIIEGDVFTANEAPPDKLIPYHHEMAYQPQTPGHVFFYCHQAAARGGETSLVLSSAVYQRMATLFPDPIHSLHEKGVTYERFIPENDDVNQFIGRGWKNTFESGTRVEAEKVCDDLKLEYEWLEDGSIKITSSLPAFGFDPVSKKHTWFNHIANLALYEFGSEVTGPRRMAFLGKNERFSAEFIDTLVKVIEDEAVNIEWESGDVMLLDNRLTLHARQPFTPPRKVMAALCY